MNDNSEIRGKVLTGLGWTYAEKFLSQGIAMIVSIILARLISPAAYGIVAIIGVFTSLAITFSQTGISSALIQKGKIESIDYSTAYHLSLLVSLFLYSGIFFLAPIIAKAYNDDAILLPLRVMGLSVVISSYNSVQQAYISRNMQFKKFFFATIIGTTLSGVIGIWMAYQGKGVWALVVQNIISITINTCFLFTVVPEKPNLSFSYSRMLSIVSFGWKILTASLINNIWQDIISLLIGKKFSTTSLAYYVKGQQYPKEIYSSILYSMARVLYPTLSRYQDNDKVRLQIARRSVQVSTFIMTPILLGFASISNHFVVFFLTEKWLPCVPYLILSCLLYIVQPIKTTCYENLKAVGRAEIYLRQEVIRKAIDLSAVILSIIIFNSPLAVVIAIVITYYLTTVIDVILLKKYIGYTYSGLFFDTLPALILSAIMAVCVYIIGKAVSVGLVQLLFMQILCGTLIYVVLSMITRNTTFKYLRKIIRRG